jgi:hypothetical protein
LRSGRKKACGAVEQKKGPREKNGIDAWPAIREPRMHAPLREPATPAARGQVRGEGPATAGSENARPRKRWQRSRTKKTTRN